MKRIAINGFGRIGRTAFRILSERPEGEVVAINDLTDAKTLAHLLKHDTAYRTWNHEVSSEEHALLIDGKVCPVFSEPDPERLPWKDLGVDVVLECTGRFVKGDAAGKHLSAGAKKVVLSAPGKGSDIPMYLLGVNDDQYRGERVVSNASCTTNCLALVAAVLHESFGIEKAMMTTVHSYTADQNLQDAPHDDLRRARAAAQNIVPTTTGAALSIGEVLPDIKGKFDGLAIRVPTMVVSLTDFTFLLRRKVSIEDVNGALEAAAHTDRFRGILEVTNVPLVSSDFIGNRASSIVDLALTKVVDGDLVKVVAWYDNEWGYSERLVDMALLVSREDEQ
ncbi:MAG: type I glyceraldehyde-3-phosphate dehydrogenase [Candidatus Moraniibacteriota bacterium]|nr:MAG: type I glyceraldehyde-3-phosphate dehydrogenase [Candidatus Moranbacteria bacterium]